MRGVLHCFSGDWAMAEEVLAMGWYLGFGGISTFKNDRGVRSILARVPEDRILFETDSPYMAPVPYRGRRNNPSLYSHRSGTGGDAARDHTGKYHEKFNKKCGNPVFPAQTRIKRMYSTQNCHELMQCKCT